MLPYNNVFSFSREIVVDTFFSRSGSYCRCMNLVQLWAPTKDGSLSSCPHSHGCPCPFPCITPGDHATSGWIGFPDPTENKQVFGGVVCFGVAQEIWAGGIWGGWGRNWWLCGGDLIASISFTDCTLRRLQNWKSTQGELFSINMLLSINVLLDQQ